MPLRGSNYMKLLLIRHAIAEDREDFARTGADDALRPLTKTGRKRMKQCARGLVRLAPRMDILATSPLVRAVDTAEIVASAYDGLGIVQIAALSPLKAPPALLEWVKQQPPDATVALVGHEPGLSTFVSWMLTGLQEPFLTLKKGGGCLLEVGEEISRGSREAALAAQIEPVTGFGVSNHSAPSLKFT